MLIINISKVCNTNNNNNNNNNRYETLRHVIFKIYYILLSSDD